MTAKIEAGALLEEAVAQLRHCFPSAVFLFSGDTLKGQFRNSNNFLFMGDYMGIGEATPEILSDSFIESRLKACSYPWNGQSYEAVREEYIKSTVLPLQFLKERHATPLILGQWDTHLDYIWQLTVMAYLEQEGLDNRLLRLRFYDDGSKDIKFKGLEEISVAGAYQAYTHTVCARQQIDLSTFLIPEQAVTVYLDISKPDGFLRKYILEKSSRYKNPYAACGLFLQDFVDLGLGDWDFLKIAYETFSETPQYAGLAQKWFHALER